MSRRMRRGAVPRGPTSLQQSPESAPLDLAVLLPRGFGLCVMNVLLVHFAVDYWAAALVMQARAKYNVKYPALYAEASHEHAAAFNGVQRAHQNCLEKTPYFFVLQLLAGLVHPYAAAAAGFVWFVARVQYVRGYSDPNSGPAGRNTGGAPLYALAQIVLVSHPAARRGASPRALAGGRPVGLTPRRLAGRARGQARAPAGGAGVRRCRRPSIRCNFYTFSVAITSRRRTRPPCRTPRPPRPARAAAASGPASGRPRVPACRGSGSSTRAAGSLPRP